MKWIIESVGVNTHLYLFIYLFLYLFLYIFYVADPTQTP
jgi:hypothetical protein